MKKICLVFIAILFLTSCLSLEMGEQFDFVDYFPEEKGVLGYVDIQNSRPLLEKVFVQFGFSPFIQNFLLRKMQYLFFSMNAEVNVDMGQEKKNLFHLLILGNLDSSFINTVLLSNGEWELVDWKFRYWVNKVQGIRIFSPEPFVFYITNDFNNENFVLPERDGELAQSSEDFLTAGDLSILLSDFSALGVDFSGSNFRMPIKQLGLNGVVYPPNLDLLATVVFETEKDSRVTRAMLLALINRKLRDWGLSEKLFNKDIKMIVDNEEVQYDGISVDMDKLILFLLRQFAPKEETEVDVDVDVVESLEEVESQ